MGNIKIGLKRTTGIQSNWLRIETNTQICEHGNDIRDCTRGGGGDFLINPLNAESNPIRHLLALVGARHIVHVSRITVK